MVRILCDNGNSVHSDARKEVFPAPLAPHTSIAALLFTRNDRMPAALALIEPAAISLGRVQGLTECFLMATAVPNGLRGYPMTVALASYPLISVSRTGLDRENLNPLCRFRMFTRASISRASAMRLVVHLMWEFRPSMPFSVTCILLVQHGASTYTSSICGSASIASNIPGPTECRYTIAQTSLTTASASSEPDASLRSSHLSVRTARVMPITESRSRLPPSRR